MDAQQMHDYEMSQRKKKGEAPGSKERVEALLRQKSASSSVPGPSFASGPLARAMAENPGLTAETAIREAEAHGF